MFIRLTGNLVIVTFNGGYTDGGFFCILFAVTLLGDLSWPPSNCGIEGSFFAFETLKLKFKI